MIAGANGENIEEDISMKIKELEQKIIDLKTNNL